MKVKIYLSGAISNQPYEETRRMFNEKEAELKNQNFEVVNPFFNGQHKEASWKDHMVADIKALVECNCIYMFNTWKSSKGATLEYLIASGLGLGIIYQENEEL